MSWPGITHEAFAHHFKKYLFDVLKERYNRNEPIINKLTSVIASQDDMIDFGKFVADIYEIAYLKSLSDHRSALEKIGLVATVKPENTKEMIDSHRIFKNQSNEG